jgi:PAS domain S-box-containing protein
MGPSRDDSRGRWQRLGGALSAVASVLLVESVVGHAMTVVLFALGVSIALCRRVGRPLLLGAATVALAVDAFVRTAMPALPASHSMTPAWLAVWAVEGLLINALMIEALAEAPGRRPADQAGRLPRLANRVAPGHLKLLLESSSQSQERFRMLVASLRDYAIVMLDPVGRIVSWNAGAERILGYSASEILGRDHSRLYLSQNVRRGVPRRNLEEAVIEGTHEVEGWRRRKDGRRLWAHVGITLLRDGSGTLRGFGMIIRDVTRRKRAEEALRRARDELEVRVEERTAELSESNKALQAEILERVAAQDVLRQQSAVLRLILDSIGDAIIVAEGPGHPLIFNPATRRLFAIEDEPVSLEQWFTPSMIRIFSPTDATDPVAGSGLAVQHRPLHRALEGEEVDDLELILRPPGSDQERWVLASSRPLRDPSGVNRGTVVVFRDITQRRRDAQELKEAKEAAEAASRAKDRFLAVLSHELRTPLTPVLLAISDLASKAGLDLEARSKLAMIRRNIEVESRLIDDLLDLTRASTGRLTLDISSVDAHHVIQHAAEICRAGLEGTELDLRLELDAPRHHVQADPARLQQVFWNLIQNAVKFTPRGGRVTVRTHNAPGSESGDPDALWVAEVADTGIGIDPDRLPRIFNAFEPRDPVLRRRYGGLGLGLAISRSVVEVHGGRLTAASAGPDQGASFTIELAAQPGPIPSGAAEAPAPPCHDPQPRPEGLNLLLIEDNADTLRCVATILRKRGHVVSTAPDSATARELITSAGFDLIISDIELPDGSGLDLIREVNRIRPTPAIAMSGFGSADDVILSKEAGFAEHLTKPIRIDDLDAAIARVVHRRGEDPPPGTMPDSPPGTIPDAGMDASVHRADLGPRPSGPVAGLVVETSAPAAEASAPHELNPTRQSRGASGSG